MQTVSFSRICCRMMPRIVSMISSATEIVDGLGALPWLVGRSHECDFPEQVRDLPVCTAPRFAVDGDSREIDRLVRQTLTESISVYQVFDDVLERLQPTHILTQIHCQVCAVSLRDVERSVAARLASRPCVVSLQPSSLAHVWEDIRRVAQSLDIERSGEDLVARLQERMRAISAAAHAVAHASAHRLHRVDRAAHGAGKLDAGAGGDGGRRKSLLVDVGGSGGRRSGCDSGDALRLRPGARGERDVLAYRRPGWRNLRAVRNHRVFVADGNQYFNRPGPRLVESLEILAAVLHSGTGIPACPCRD